MASDINADRRRDFIGYGRQLPKVIWPNKAELAMNIVRKELIKLTCAPNRAKCTAKNLGVENAVYDLGSTKIYVRLRR